jgi:hypothetical protein
MHRKERRRQIPTKSRSQVQALRAGTPDVHLSVSLIEGGKEPESLNVIGVKVGEEYVDSSVLS